MAGARVVRLVTIPRVHSMMIHLGGGGGNNGMKEMGKRVEGGQRNSRKREKQGERRKGNPGNTRNDELATICDVLCTYVLRQR